MDHSKETDFDITIAEASAVEARVHVRPRLAGGRDPGAHWLVGGTISGPYCERARTLPATMPFQMLDTAAEPLAEAVIPDPCFWTRELPHVYRVHIEYQLDGQRSQFETTIGLGRRDDKVTRIEDSNSAQT